MAAGGGLVGFGIGSSYGERNLKPSFHASGVLGGSGARNDLLRNVMVTFRVQTAEAISRLKIGIIYSEGRQRECCRWELGGNEESLCFVILCI